MAKVLLPVDPSDKTIQNMVAAGQRAVLELVCTNGTMGHQAIAEAYMRRIYAAMVSNQTVVLED